MNDKSSEILAAVIRRHFYDFVAKAFKMEHGTRLGEQPYVHYMCAMIQRVLDGQSNRLLINLPPQHLKSFVGTICLTAYVLGVRPRTRIIIVGYNDDFADALCERVRDMMRTHWYQKIFETRIRTGHSRSNDFATTEGGGIFAVGATGAVTGRTADFIVYDDPHQINDWNAPHKISAVNSNFNILRSRLHDRQKGCLVVIAHRVAEDDLSAALLEEGDWDHVALPLRAPKARTYTAGDFHWDRDKGDVLRSDAYPKKEIERLQYTQIAPPYYLFYQQGVLGGRVLRPQPSHFGRFSNDRRPPAPVVLSVDPGQGGGSRASRLALQVWSTHNKTHYLIDEFAEHCDLEQQRNAFMRMVARHRPSAILIEKTASGPSLFASVRQRIHCPIHLIVPRKSKAERLARHLRTLCSSRIYIRDSIPTFDDFVAEIINFPSDYDDRVDAMTQYLDFISTNPHLPEQRPRDSGIVTLLGSDYARARS